MVKEIDMQVQEAQKAPNKMDSKRSTPRHSIIKMPKVKDKERTVCLMYVAWLGIEPTTWICALTGN